MYLSQIFGVSRIYLWNTLVEIVNVVSVYLDSGGSDAYDEPLVQKWAFATQLGWIVALWLTTHSYLFYLWRAFPNAPKGRKLLCSHLATSFWAIGSVSGEPIPS